MSLVVVDTDIASYIFNNHGGAELISRALSVWEPVLSFMSIAEMRAGSLMASWGTRRRDRLEEFILRFEVIHSDDHVCALWARIRAGARATGRAVSPEDAWIAATALSLNAPLATNNRRDFEHIEDLELLDL